MFILNFFMVTIGYDMVHALGYITMRFGTWFYVRVYGICLMDLWCISRGLLLVVLMNVLVYGWSICWVHDWDTYLMSWHIHEAYGMVMLVHDLYMLDTLWETLVGYIVNGLCSVLDTLFVYMSWYICTCWWWF